MNYWFSFWTKQVCLVTPRNQCVVPQRPFILGPPQAGQVVWMFSFNFGVISRRCFNMSMIKFIFSGCGMNMSLPSLHSDVKCFMLPACSAVQCCVRSPELKRNYEVHFSIDHCSQSIHVQIEKVQYLKTLHDLKWGTSFSFYQIKFLTSTLSIVFYQYVDNFLHRRSRGV